MQNRGVAEVLYVSNRGESKSSAQDPRSERAEVLKPGAAAATNVANAGNWKVEE